MKVAMTVWGNRVSPVFDSAQTILLAQIEGTAIIDRQREFIPVTIPAVMARKLVQLDIDTLICGAISEHPALIIEEAGIRLLPFIAGNAEQILEDYARNMPITKYTMPGCCPADQRNGSGIDPETV